MEKEVPQQNISNKGIRRVLRLTIPALLLIGFSLLIWSMGAAGLSSLLSAYAAMSNRDEPATAAIRISPADPEAHYTRATILARNGKLSDALAEYEAAVRLRPDDYFLWLELGRAHEQNGDLGKAITDTGEAVRLAPYYAQPHWQLGNLLLRKERMQDAFNELRRAATSDPTRWPILIDLVWQLQHGDVKAVKQIIRPETNEAHLALADYLKKRGEVAEAIAQLNAVDKSSTEQTRRAWLNDFLKERRYREAYDLWSSVEGPGGKEAEGALIDGGFEREIKLDAPGFGWQLMKEKQGVSFSLDPVDPREGAISLRLDFKGDSPISTPLVSQLVLAEKNARYRLRFAARVKEVVSGGTLQVSVLDMSEAGGNRQLAQALTLPQGSGGWQEYTLDFTTGASTEAVLISLQRAQCSSQPCPIFGSLWLDDFSIQKQ